jgi:hypothetical protein
VKRRSFSGLAIAPAALALAAMPAEPSSGGRSTARELPLLTVAQLSATETVRMEAGSSHRIATLQPGDSTSVRADGARTVRIAIVQGTEARTLRASMTLTFPGPGIRSYCYPYFPPSVALSLHY